MTTTTYPIGRFTPADAEALAGKIIDVTEIDRDTGRTTTYRGAYVLGLAPSRSALCLVVVAEQTEWYDPALTGVLPRNIFLHDVHQVGGVLEETGDGWRPVSGS
jgi:hypothetical protein